MSTTIITQAHLLRHFKGNLQGSPTHVHDPYSVYVIATSCVGVGVALRGEISEEVVDGDPAEYTCKCVCVCECVCVCVCG